MTKLNECTVIPSFYRFTLLSFKKRNTRKRAVLNQNYLPTPFNNVVYENREERKSENATLAKMALTLNFGFRILEPFFE